MDALDAMIRAGLVFIDRYPAFTQLYVAELWRTNRAWQSTLMVVRQQAVAVVEDVLREGVADGEFSDEIDVPLTASALVGMVLVAALDWQSFQPERSLDDVHAALSRLLQGRVSGARAERTRKRRSDVAASPAGHLEPAPSRTPPFSLPPLGPPFRSVPPGSPVPRSRRPRSAEGADPGPLRSGAPCRRCRSRAPFRVSTLSFTQVGPIRARTHLTP